MSEDLLSKLLLHVPLVSPLAGAVLVAMAASALKAARAEVEKWQTFDQTLASEETRLQAVQQARMSAMEAELAARAASSYSASDAPAVVAELPRTRTPLEASIEHFQDRLGSLLNRLNEWSTAARAPLDGLTLAPREMKRIYDDLPRANGQGDLDAASRRIASLFPDLLRILIRKTDRDLDPRREDDALQSALLAVVSATSLSLIDPSSGEPLDTKLHHSLGIFAQGSLDQRGKVGEVRCRGLRSSSGRVIEPAEILEYD